MGRIRRMGTVAGAVALSAALLQPAGAEVDPPTYEATMAPGESATVDKVVTLPEDGSGGIVDVVVNVDLSGSYGDDLPHLRAQLPAVFDEVSDASDARFGLTSFVDFPYSPWGASGDYAYRLDQDLSDDRDAFVGAVQAMTIKFGSDEPESQYESLYQIATGAGRALPGNGSVAPGQNPTFRPEAVRVVVITTDASFHVTDDSTCSSPAPPCPFGYPGPTRDEVVEALNAEGIRVIALKAPGAGAEMDDLAAATGGSVQHTAGDSSDIAEAILAGLDEIGSSIQPAADADCPLEVTFDPPGYDGVAPGESVGFTETITVPADAEPGSVVTCTVSFGRAGTQQLVITVGSAGCGEDGLALLTEAGVGGELISGAVHNEVEPFLSDLSMDLGEAVHELNCSLVVPVEDLVDDLYLDLVALLDELLGGGSSSTGSGLRALLGG